jgi:hypothetical protein
MAQTVQRTRPNLVLGGTLRGTLGGTVRDAPRSAGLSKGILSATLLQSIRFLH